MLKRIVFVVIFLVLIGSMSSLLKGKTINEPEMINVIYYLSHADNKLIAVDRQTVRFIQKAKAFGMLGLKNSYKIEGDRSAFRLKNDLNHEFIVQVPMGIDPSGIKLFQFGIKKGNRILLANDVSGFAKVTMGPGPIQINVTKYGQSSYKLSLVNKLDIGEYAFVLGMGASAFDAFCFGIEPVE
jgi:hypothetical protein